MRDLLVLFVHLIVTMVRLAKPGGLRAVIAESVLTRHQILILNRGRKRAPNLRVSDRIIAGLCTLLMRRSRVLRCGIAFGPKTECLYSSDQLPDSHVRKPRVASSD